MIMCASVPDKPKEDIPIRRGRLIRGKDVMRRGTVNFELPKSIWELGWAMFGCPGIALYCKQSKAFRTPSLDQHAITSIINK